MGISVEDAVKELQARETVIWMHIHRHKTALCNLQEKKHTRIRCGFLQKRKL